MTLTILVPHEVFATERAVSRIVAETPEGSFGLLPRRRDCVAALVPGILEFETSDGVVFVAVGDGVLVKAGEQVRVSVRRAVVGADLGKLRDAIEREGRARDEDERGLRRAMERLESGFFQRVVGVGHG